MQCANHPQAEAAGMCTYCGKPFCRDCLVEVKGKMYCKGDLDKVMDEAKSSSAQGAPTINITNANTSSNVNSNVNTAGGFGIGFPVKKKLVALLLCIFAGWLGFHRFYVGKTGTGIIWLFTFGLFGIGAVIDFVIILLGGFRNKWGRPLA